MTQSGAGTAKNENPIGNPKIRKSGQPAVTSTQPMITGIADRTSKVRSSWVRARNSNSNPQERLIQPTMGAGFIAVDLICSRDCQVNQSDAAIMSGPWP